MGLRANGGYSCQRWTITTKNVNTSIRTQKQLFSNIGHNANEMSEPWDTSLPSLSETLWLLLRREPQAQPSNRLLPSKGLSKLGPLCLTRSVPNCWSHPRSSRSVLLGNKSGSSHVTPLVLLSHPLPGEQSESQVGRKKGMKAGGGPSADGLLRLYTMPRICPPVPGLPPLLHRWGVSFTHDTKASTHSVQGRRCSPLGPTGVGGAGASTP